MNTKKNKTNRIGIDARFYGPLGKGLGRYTQEIVNHIIKFDQANEYVIFLGQENFNDFNSSDPRIKKVLVKIRWYGLKEQLLFPFYIWREQVDLMHFPHFNVPIFCPVKFIVTIHDLILIKFPTRRATTLGPLKYAVKNFFYKLVIFKAVKRARRVLTVSNYTKQEIISQFKTQEKKIVVTYEGVADAFSGQAAANRPEEVLANYNITKPYLLYVGNAYPHKNLEGLIQVYVSLYREHRNLALVLVGKEDYFYNRLKEQAKNYRAKIIFPGFVPDLDLRVLYAASLAYIFPSFCEGFGLPALEAMAFGSPVVSSDKTSLPEVLGQAAVYFDPKDEPQMRATIKAVINDESLRQDLKNKGFKQVKKYSWSECAQKTLKVYFEILNN